MSGAARFFWRLWQLTWGLPQTLAGFVVFLLCRARGRKSYTFGGAVCTEWGRDDGVSLGMFVFCPKNGGIHLHEYGHTWQSLLLGPLYILVVLLPSLIWAGLPAFRKMRLKKRIPYSRLYCERWADSIGAKYRLSSRGLPEKRGRPPKPEKPQKHGKRKRKKPESAEKPQRPASPEHPEESGNTNEPGSPEEPGNPEETENPAKPENPEESGGSEESETSDESENSDEPGSPEEPENPEEHETI